MAMPPLASWMNAARALSRAPRSVVSTAEIVTTDPSGIVRASAIDVMDGEGDGFGVGDGVSSGVGVGSIVGVGSGVGVPVGVALGDGVGSGVEVGTGVGVGVAVGV